MKPALWVPAAAAAFVAGATVLFAFDPATSRAFPFCPVHALTGLHCPGCGSLRAAHRLLHGDVAGAMSMNPLMVIALPLLLALVLRPAWTQRRWVPWCAFAVLILYAVLRNIPAWPFHLLAPG